MNKKRTIVVTIIAIAIMLVAVVGATYAYYTVTLNKTNEENSKTSIKTKAYVKATLDLGSKIEASNVLPGYKVYKTVTVSGSGPEDAEPVLATITLTPDVTDFGNHIKYTIYNSNVENAVICTESKPIVEEDGVVMHYDAMTCDTTKAGVAVQSGIFEGTTPVILDVVVEYNTSDTYYILIEYLNDEEQNQNKEQGKTFIINIEFKEQEEKTLLSDYIINKSNVDASIVKLEHEATYQTENLTEYRYSGTKEEVNNYVYFGCSDNCTEDNLYQIIGVIPTQETVGGEYVNRVKLIKASYYTENTSGYLESRSSAPGGQGYRWNKTSGSNIWYNSTLYSVLNNTYYNSLGEYQTYIAPAVWYLGAPTNSSYTTYTPNEFYELERSSTKAYSGGELATIANVGLMYPSDYGYSIEESYWDQAIYINAGTYVTNAWLYKLISTSYEYEWTMTSNSIKYDSISEGAWTIFPTGALVNLRVYHAEDVLGVRPVFYLDSEVLYSGGEGTNETPYRIAI